MRFFATLLGLTVLAATSPLSAFADTTIPVNAPPSIASASQVELVPGGTEVPIHVVSSLSSSSANVGDLFSFAAAQDVLIDRRIVVKKGAEGQGEVTTVQKAGGSGRSGSLGLKYDWIFAADGGKIQLSDIPQSNAEEDRKGASSTATIVGFATFGIGGLFGHNFARGKNMTIDQTKILNAFVASNVHVTTTEISSAGNAGYDH